jgi:TatA/E family protein of Tat protein translocase
MFGSIGPAELILIFIVALLVFGPKKLPEIGRSVGKAIREFKKTSEEIKSRIEEEIEASEVKDVAKTLETEAKEIKDNLTKELEKHDAEEGQKVS